MAPAIDKFRIDSMEGHWAVRMGDEIRGRNKQCYLQRMIEDLADPSRLFIGPGSDADVDEVRIAWTAYQYVIQTSTAKTAAANILLYTSAKLFLL